MRGRALSWEVVPFSFQEFLDYKGIAIESSLSSSQRLLVQNGFIKFNDRLNNSNTNKQILLNGILSILFLLYGFSIVTWILISLKIFDTNNIILP